MTSLLPDTLEKELLERTRAGDGEAFGQLFHAYRDKLYGFICKLSASREIAEDVVQDVFLRIWLMRGELREITHFNAFLFRMARNHAINQLMRRTRELRLLRERLPEPSSPYQAADEALSYHTIHRSIEEIVSRLPARQKRVYELSRDQHLKQGEIADLLHISPSTVKNHLTQALRRIQHGLEQYLPLVSSGVAFFWSLFR